MIDICSDVMNLRSVSFECKCKLEEIKDDYKIEVSFLGSTEKGGWSLKTGFVSVLLFETVDHITSSYHHTYTYVPIFSYVNQKTNLTRII